MNGSAKRLPHEDDSEPLQGDEEWLTTLDDPHDTTADSGAS